MASALAAPLRGPGIASLLPRLSSPTLLSSSRFTSIYARQLSIPLLPIFAFPVPSAINLNIPEILSEIWEGILRAVPKKKTSHSKKRHRQMAGKALKDVRHLCKCPACGRIKRMHHTCDHCMERLSEMMRGGYSPPSKGGV